MGRGKDFTVEEPVKCHLEKLVDGVRLVGKHDGDVTDLSISQWMSTRLASGSNDGTVRIELTTSFIKYFEKLHYFECYCKLFRHCICSKLKCEYVSPLFNLLDSKPVFPTTC